MAHKKTLILVGGGHTHSLLLKKIQKKPLPDTRLILLSSTRYTAYSGMLPGVISGYYSPEQAHIDLKQLAKYSGCDFFEESVNQPNTESRTLLTDSGNTYSYDLLSINIGSTQSPTVKANQCRSIKPIGQFLYWLYHELPDDLEAQPHPIELVIIGAGAAGVETAMALKQRYFGDHRIQVHIISSSQILPGYPDAIQSMALKELASANIQVHPEFRVSSIKDQQLLSAQGQSLPYHQLLLATSASPPDWPSISGLATDANGFILINEQLQSISHSNVFSAGDIATINQSDLAKCGVHAVRQANTLYTNLLNALIGQPLRSFQAQKQTLTLLNCSNGQAIASRGWFRAKGQWVWFWKRFLDRQFMKQFPAAPSEAFKINKR